jgi:tetratricopeptide (TPR) repeat protein
MEEPWNAVLRARAKTAGPCLDEETMVAFYSDQLGQERVPAVRQHLSECPSCLETAKDARRFLEAMGPAGATADAKAASRPARGRWWTLLSAASVLLAVGWWWARSPTPDGRPPQETAPPGAAGTKAPNRWAELHVPRARYSPSALPSDLVWRDGEARPASPDAFADAMRAYQRDEFAEAERRLAAVLAREPRRAEAHFYRGVCLLMLGRARDAVTPLTQARARADGENAEDAAFYLALAYLKEDAPDRALPLLDTLREGRRHVREAERLRQEVTAVLGGRN